MICFPKMFLFLSTAPKRFSCGTMPKTRRVTFTDFHSAFASSNGIQPVSLSMAKASIWKDSDDTKTQSWIEILFRPSQNVLANFRLIPIVVERSRFGFSYTNQGLQSNALDRSQFIPHFALPLQWRADGLGCSARFFKIYFLKFILVLIIDYYCYLGFLVIDEVPAVGLEYDMFPFKLTRMIIPHVCDYFSAISTKSFCKLTCKPWRNWFSETRTAQPSSCGRSATSPSRKNKFRPTTLSKFHKTCLFLLGGDGLCSGRFPFIPRAIVQLVHRLDSSRPVTLVLNKGSHEDVAVSQISVDCRLCGSLVVWHVDILATKVTGWRADYSELFISFFFYFYRPLF